MPEELALSLGLGTAGNDDFEECAETVERALEVGYRHIDTAQMYDNEEAVGAGLERAPVDREEIVVATKVHPDNLAYEDAIDTTYESLDRLGLKQVDLLYVHWPTSAYDPEETLAAFDELREEGVTRHVGVSNFTPELLEEAREALDSPIAAHQVECHPMLPQEELRAYAADDGHHFVAYSPIGKAKILDHPTIAEIADTHDVTPAQAVLAWELQRRIVPIPQGRGDHVEENYDAIAVDLPEEALERIDEIGKRRRFVEPDDAPWK